MFFFLMANNDQHPHHTESLFFPKHHKTSLKFIEISLKSNAILKYSDDSSQFGIIYTFNIHVLYFIM